jgi:hypothetical protein
MKKEPRLKNKLNLFGAMNIRGRNVSERNKNRQPTMKKAPNA